MVAHELAAEMLHAAREQADGGERLIGHRMAGLTALLRGQLVPARAHLEQVLALYEPERHRSLAALYAFDPRVSALVYRPVTLALLGYPEQARRLNREMLATAREEKHVVALSFALQFAGWLDQVTRNQRRLRRRTEALMALAAEQRFPYWLAYASVLRGWALGEGGQVEEGVAQIRRGRAPYQATGVTLYLPYFDGLLAETHIRLGQEAEGLSLLTEALARVDRTGERWFAAELHRLRGGVLLSLRGGEQEEAEACFYRAMAVAQEQSAKLWELRAATSLARLWRDRGRRAEARDLLGPFYTWLTEGFNTPDLQGAKALLDELG